MGFPVRLAGGGTLFVVPVLSVAWAVDRAKIREVDGKHTGRLV